MNICLLYMIQEKTAIENNDITVLEACRIEHNNSTDDVKFRLFLSIQDQIDTLHEWNKSGTSMWTSPSSI